MARVLQRGDRVRRDPKYDYNIDPGTLIIVGHGYHRWEGTLLYHALPERPDDDMTRMLPGNAFLYIDTVTQEELLTHPHKRVQRINLAKVKPPVNKWKPFVAKTNIEKLRVLIHEAKGNPECRIERVRYKLPHPAYNPKGKEVYGYAIQSVFTYHEAVAVEMCHLFIKTLLTQSWIAYADMSEHWYSNDDINVWFK